MSGISKDVLDKINKSKVVERVLSDIRTDFIFAPHYSCLFLKASNDIWSIIEHQLKSSSYCSQLPITISVPKEKGFSRPGSILNPIDRFVYQMIADFIAKDLEKNLNRNRVFSHIYDEDSSKMFKPSHDSWSSLQSAIKNLCKKDGFIIKADIAHYFERIPQHHIINLIDASGCDHSIVSLLEKILLDFQERNSYGIIQGVYPSDLLGNFFLSEFDSYCDQNNIPSARYVDDMFLFYDTEQQAKKGLHALIEKLRKAGLHLSEQKSGIKKTKEILFEESEVDILFERARKEALDEIQDDSFYGYGFTAEWEHDEVSSNQLNDEKITLRATESLYQSRKRFPIQSDKIEKFCLPLLCRSGSDIALKSICSDFMKKPHLTKLYLSYLKSFVSINDDVPIYLQNILMNCDYLLNYQKMYILASLINCSNVSNETIKIALQWMEDYQISYIVRSIAAIFVAKFGNPNQKRTIKTAYEKEPSEYVRSSILFSSKYFSDIESKTCKKAWKGHSLLNSLIAKVI